MNEAPGPFAGFFGRLWRQKPLGIASAIVILILILLAIFAEVLAPYPVDQLNLAERLQAVHGAGAVAGAVARAVPDDCGVQLQHVG